MGKKLMLFSIVICLVILNLTTISFAQGHVGITDCFVCHDFASGYYSCNSCHDFDQGYYPGESHYNLWWIATSIEYPEGNIHKPVKFTTLSWDETWGPTPDGTLADGNDTKLDGPCEVCHTQTAYHTNTGDGTTHFDGQNCVVCHPHFADPENYFAPQLKGPQSHETHLHAEKGPQISECTVCHNPNDFTKFADGNPLETTNVCDECHSPDGAFDGVNDPIIGAKPNWEEGIYETESSLKEGKENWCATCHDDGTSVVNNVSAPNVMGDNIIYGYNMSGHGYYGVKCEDCHDLTMPHTDGEARTYSASKSNYRIGYRLNANMDIPRYGTYGQATFELCFKCHDYQGLLGFETNFRDDYDSEYYHKIHLDEIFRLMVCWDSDWDGEVDSAMSCTACHNVHGSPMEIDGQYYPCKPMIRHGELISTPGTQDKVPALDFKWYDEDLNPTATFEQSYWGGLISGAPGNLTNNHVCWGCHPNGEIKYYRTVAEQKVSIEKVWTTDLSNKKKRIFEPGEPIRYHIKFTIIGTNHYRIVAKGKAFNLTGNEWSTKFSHDDVLTSGTYEWCWDETVPAEATPSSGAKVRIVIKMYDEPEGVLLSKDKKRKKFKIAE